MKASDNPAGLRRSVFARFCRWLFSWKTLRRSLVALAGLITLIALLVTEENWRGKRDWDNFKREWEAKGERFDIASFIPKPVPDDQNFVMIPFFAPLLQKERNMAAGEWKDTNGLQSSLDVYGGVHGKRALSGNPLFGNLKAGELTDLQEWQKFYRANTNFTASPRPQYPAKDVLLALKNFEPVLTELREASHRPGAQFPLYLDRYPGLPLIHLSNLRAVALVLRLRATAFLADRQSSEALQDLRVSFRLADSLRPEPFLISHLVRLSLLDDSLNVVWEGLARHQWKETELVELQTMLASIDLFADYGRVMRGERAGSNVLLGSLRQERRVWAGLIYQNQKWINRLYQLRVFPLIDAGLHRVYLMQSNQLTNAPEIRRTTPYNILARLLLPAIGKSAVKTARVQAFLDQAAAASALERFRLVNGQYPENLQALVPRFMKRIPPDVISGNPLQYRRTDAGRIMLRSAGWNLENDGAVTTDGHAKTSIEGAKRSDWVWTYPVSSE
ncbi:MAG TPA: hypothetical protein VN887_05360 [Candidatus Angelobacter sp.]|nr:hypothetical protein [Candidatus Angelobacter sp.]